MCWPGRPIRPGLGRITPAVLAFWICALFQKKLDGSQVPICRGQHQGRISTSLAALGEAPLSSREA